MKTHPNDAKALYGLALTLKAMGDLRGALEQFERLLDLNPGHDEYAAALELADTQRALGQSDEALGTLELLVKKSPRVKHQLALAEHLVEIGKRGNARKLLSAALTDYEHAPSFVRKRERSHANSARSVLEQLA